MSGVARIRAGDLAGLDGLALDALVLPLFAVERQPTSVAGFVDWRLAGRLARLFTRKTFTGALGETLLMSSLGRVGAGRIFLFGLGDPKTLTESLARERARGMVATLDEACARTVGLTAPSGAAEGRTVGVDLVSSWLEAAKDAKTPFEEVVLLDGDGVLEAARSRLETAAKRGGLTWQA